MKNVLSKLAEARLKIKASPVKKDAKNEYSKYDYFSPELVSKMVNDACIETNSICLFNLKKDELGYYGELIFTDLESGEALITIMRTEKPVITATNETQQMGGMQTYTKRYCLMNLFDIEDNTIDFDNLDNTKKPVQKTDQKTNGTPVNKELPWLNEGTKDYNNAVNKLIMGIITMETVKKNYRLSKVVEEKLNKSIPKKQPA